MNQNFDHTPPTLPPLLDEFRMALQDEIEVVKRKSSSSAIPLSNGHKIASQGSAYQYTFLVDSVLNTPDGAPGDLVVSGKAPMAATIVSVEGLQIVISVESDLGKFIPTARLQTNLAMLMRKLIERIESNATAENSAAKRMLGFTPVSGAPCSLSDKPKLNQYQMDALESALGRNLTVIWGPPGTGKTHTIGTITEYLNARSRTVLIVSHTNTAVDQAIKHVAKSMKSQLADGAVVRVGEVKEEVLRTDFPEVLLKTQIERQSRELVDERERLASRRKKLTDEIADVEKSIEVVQWLARANQTVAVIQDAVNVRDQLMLNEKQAAAELDVLRQQHSGLLNTHKIASKALFLRKHLISKQAESSDLEGQFETFAEKREILSKKLAEQNYRIKVADRIGPIRKERASLPSHADQTATIASLSEKVTVTKQRLAEGQMAYVAAQALLEQTVSAGILGRMLKRLPNPESQRDQVNALSNQVTALNVEVTATVQAYETATSKLAQIIEMDGELSRYNDISTYQDELDVKDQFERRLEQVIININALDSLWTPLKSEIRETEKEYVKLSGEIDGDIKTTYMEVNAKLQKYKQLQKIVKEARKAVSEKQEKVNRLVCALLLEIEQRGDLEDNSSAIEESLVMVRAYLSHLADEYASINEAALNQSIIEHRKEIQSLGGEIGEIDTKLAMVQREVINKAAVIGATLTKTYLSDDIQSRKFDTVILDEASMAPIPALWVASLLAENNLIIVGDFKQLPPIVLSTNKLTQKWLGSDIFEASGIKAKWDKLQAPSHFIPLLEQRRMLPAIADVANRFYDGMLKNAFTENRQYRDYESFKAWYVKNWKYDNPVVLIDTGPLNAWVTSVMKNGNSSRLNFLSATVSVDIAEQLLSDDRSARREGGAKRMLIVSPYRAHAKLVNVLLKDFTNLQDEVVAGTAHSFQGSEADVVIFDLVVDEPHFRVNLFMPTLDEQLKSLLNVALTRAKFRLFVIGDFDYCTKLGRKAFLGKTLLPFLLERFPRVDARNIVPDGLAGRAAKAQMSALGGQIDPDSERLVVTQVHFYRLLSSDLSFASQRVIIYSPFLTSDRISFLLPQLQAAIERGVNIYIITKALSERPKIGLQTIKKIENQLTRIGITIIHKLRMHEKLVFIDEDVTWSGSLNPLSFSNTQEIMERRKSKTVLSDYFQILRLQELLAAQGHPEGKCPICGAEMMAAEGADQPYYWRCINKDCFTRSIDQPYPFDGVLVCGSCNSAVEFGYWGDYPHWRCTVNKKHRQKIFKSHLRLPKMASRIPVNERQKVCNLLGVEKFDDLTSGHKHESKNEIEIPSLFEDMSLFDNMTFPEKTELGSSSKKNIQSEAKTPSLFDDMSLFS